MREDLFSKVGRMYMKTVSVSYTHLDVYKRQVSGWLRPTGSHPTPAAINSRVFSGPLHGHTQGSVHGHTRYARAPFANANVPDTILVYLETPHDKF